LKERFDHNKITIIGALYDIESGKVTFKNIQ
jgi:carbonic anhydrase